MQKYCEDDMTRALGVKLDNSSELWDRAFLHDGVLSEGGVVDRSTLIRVTDDNNVMKFTGEERKKIDLVADVVCTY